MALHLIDAVWFWPHTTAPFRAVYGRLEGPYSKDYLQTSGDCSDVFDDKFARQGAERYPIQYAWPGGSVSDVVKPGGGYNPPNDLRLNFRWPFSRAPTPWKLFPQPGPLAAFPGDPTKVTAAAANGELDQFLAGHFDGWLIAVKLRGEEHRLHVRAYMGRPPADRRYASLDNLPYPLLSTIRALTRGGCGTYVPGREGLPDIEFDPDRVFDAWANPVAEVSAPPELGLIASFPVADLENLQTVAEGFEVVSDVGVVTGMPFLACVRTPGEADGAAYLGIGVVARLIVSPEDVSRLVCEVAEYRPFEEPVPARLPAGDYLEPGGATPGYYDQPLRVVPLAVIDTIVAQGSVAGEETGVVAPAPATHPAPYPTSEHSRRIDAYAMDVATAEVQRRYPDAMIVRMPHNNPGHDIRAVQVGRVRRYIEVKGSSGELGTFFLSEGERRFSEGNGARYSLCIVRNIDLNERTHEIVWHDGPVSIDVFGLTVRQWQGTPPN